MSLENKALNDEELEEAVGGAKVKRCEAERPNVKVNITGTASVAEAAGVANVANAAHIMGTANTENAANTANTLKR